MRLQFFLFSFFFFFNVCVKVQRDVEQRCLTCVGVRLELRTRAHVMLLRVCWQKLQKETFSSVQKNKNHSFAQSGSIFFFF